MTEPSTRRRQPEPTRTDVAVGPGGESAAVQRLRAKQEKVAQLATIVKSSGPLFARLLPDHIGVETFMGSAGAALWKSEDLMDGALADPQAFLIALRESAQLGHIPGTDAYWLTPRKVNRVPSVLGIEGYQGIMERMFRAGGVLSIRCHTVRANDLFDPDGGPGGSPVHRYGGPLGAFSSRSDRGDIIGVYAYAWLPGGAASQVILMGMEELLQHRAAAATMKVWDAWPEAMYRKTALRQLEPYVPTSVEYRVRRDQSLAAIAAVAPTQPIRAEVPAPPTDDDPDDTSPGVASPPPSAPSGVAQPSDPSGRPVLDVEYDQSAWVDPNAWDDLPVAKPGEGVLPEDR